MSQVSAARPGTAGLANSAESLTQDHQSCDDRDSGVRFTPAGYSPGAAGWEAKQMLALVGSRVWYRTIGSGVFHCERCGGDRPYRHRSGRRWAHLLGVPVASLGDTGEHLRCTCCRTCYRVELLAVPTIDQMLVALLAGTKAAVLAMLTAGGAASPAARRRGIQMIRDAGAPEFDDTRLTAALADPEAGSQPRRRDRSCRRRDRSRRRRASRRSAFGRRPRPSRFSSRSRPGSGFSRRLLNWGWPTDR